MEFSDLNLSFLSPTYFLRPGKRRLVLARRQELGQRCSHSPETGIARRGRRKNKPFYKVILRQKAEIRTGVLYFNYSFLYQGCL